MSRRCCNDNLVVVAALRIFVKCPLCKLGYFALPFECVCRYSFCLRSFEKLIAFLDVILRRGKRELRE